MYKQSGQKILFKISPSMIIKSKHFSFFQIAKLVWPGTCSTGQRQSPVDIGTTKVTRVVVDMNALVKSRKINSLLS